MPTPFRTLALAIVVGVTLAGVAGCSSSSSGGFGPAPIATADAYTVVGNETFTRPAGTGLLANDIGTGSTVTSFDATSTQGATVSVSSDGSFTYTPVAGNRTTDTFTYTITNLGGTATATATITISGMVWWIDNSGSNGTGTQASPFNSIANADAGATDQTGDIFYVATGSGAYDGNLTLLDDQQVVGAGAALVVGSTTVETAGTAPTWTATSGNAITLGADNTITGVDFGNTAAGVAIIDGGSASGDLQVSDVAISGTGGAISLLNGVDATASVVLDSVNSSAAPGAVIALDTYIGTFTVTGSTVVSAPTGRGIHLANCASGTITFDTISITGYLTTAIEVDAVAATVSTGTIGLGAHGGTSGADSIVVNDTDNVTFGDLTIQDADEVAITITTHPASQTLTFGDVTSTTAADDYALEVLACAGTINFGTVDLDGGAVSGNESIRIAGLASTGDISFTATTAGAGITIPSPQGTLDFGVTDCDGPLLVDTPTAATLTFSTLDLDSTGHGMRLTNGDTLTTVNLTTAPAEIAAVGVVLEIDDYAGDDGGGNGWSFGTVAGTGTSGMVLTDIAHDFTVATATNFTSMTGTAIAITNAGAVDFTFGGTTTCGATSPNQVDRGVVLTTNNAAATFAFGTLAIDAVTDGFTADAGVLDFTGTAPVITAQDEHAISISNCQSTGSGSGLWTFGNTATTALATSVENVCEFNGCSANITFSGTITGTTAAGLGGNVLDVDTHTGNVTTVGLVSASGFTEADAHGVFCDTVNGNVTLGAVTVSNFSGSTATGIEVTGHVGGNVTLGGAMTLTNITGGTNRGIEIGGTSTANVTFSGATTMSGITPNDSYGLLIQGLTGTVDSTVAGSFQIDGMTGSNSASMRLENINGATNFLGDFGFVGGNTAIQLDTLSGQTVNFDGAVDISGSGFVRGVYVDSCPTADIDFDDIVISLGAIGLVAIDLRGDTDGSNAGASFTIDSSDGTSGIAYATGANATAIFADQLAALTIGGASGNEFLFNDIGTGSTDGGEANIQNGPHAIYARDCQAVTVQFVTMDTIGDTGTDGVECGVYVRNTTVAPTSYSIASTTINEYVDGHASFFENSVGSSSTTLIATANLFGDSTSPNNGGWGYYVSLDGTATDVTGTLVATGNTIQNQVNTSPLNEGGIFLELLNGAGGTTPFQATLGDIGGSGSTISNVSGDMIRVDCTGGADIACTVENFGFAFTPGNAGDMSGVYTNIDALVGEVSDIDFLVSNCTFSGFDNGTFEPVLCEFDGATTTSDVKVEVSDCTFASGSAVVAGIHVTTSNDCYDGSLATGVFDVRLDNNNLTSTGGIETSFTGTDESLISIDARNNTFCTAFVMDRDSGAGTDILQIGDVLGTTDANASDVDIEAILTAGGGNNNTDTASPPVTFTISVAGDTAVIVDASGIAAPTSP